MELKLDNGIDKCLTSVMGWMRYILKSGQKKSDFSTDLPPEKQYTDACQNVRNILSQNFAEFSVTLKAERIAFQCNL